MPCFSVQAILGHSAPPCYQTENTKPSYVGFRPTDRASSTYPPASSPISVNIGMDALQIAGGFLGRPFTRATSLMTSADSIASVGISQGAHGTTWVAGILFDSISRRTTLWLMPKRSDASSKVMVWRDIVVAMYAGSS